MTNLTRLILAFIAGYCDTATFVHMHGVFSAHVTGNFVLFAAALSSGLEASDYLKLATFPVFLLAVLCGSYLFVSATRRKASGLQVTLVVITGLLVLASLLAGLVRTEVSAADITVTLLLVLAMGLQNTLHHFMPGAMTTVMTGTVVTTTARFARKMLGDTTLQPAAPGTTSTFALMCLFAGGCLSGAVLAHSAWPLALLLPSALMVLNCLRERTAFRSGAA